MITNTFLIHWRRSKKYALVCYDWLFPQLFRIHKPTRMPDIFRVLEKSPLKHASNSDCATETKPFFCIGFGNGLSEFDANFRIFGQFI